VEHAALKVLERGRRLSLKVFFIEHVFSVHEEAVAGSVPQAFRRDELKKPVCRDCLLSFANVLLFPDEIRSLPRLNIVHVQTVPRLQDHSPERKAFGLGWTHKIPSRKSVSPNIPTFCYPAVLAVTRLRLEARRPLPFANLAIAKQQHFPELNFALFEFWRANRRRGIGMTSVPLNG